MEHGSDLLVAYGYQVLFGWAFLVQCGAPIPGAPILLSAGALAGRGTLSLPIAVAVGMVATLAADLIWYGLGRLQGNRALSILARIALDPDSTIRRAKERFGAHRARLLLVATFLPGLNPLAAGLAGTVRLDLRTFLLYETVGALLWAAGWMTAGYLAADFLSALAVHAMRIGKPLLILVAIGFVAWLLFKWVVRWRFLRHLRAARMTVEDLKERLDAGEPIVLVDVRTALDVEAAPYRIPGAVRLEPGDIGQGRPPFQRADTVVFYCSEPNEATSARLTMFGYRRGYRHVHPLRGGLESWRSKGFPVESLTPEGSTSAG